MRKRQLGSTKYIRLGIIPISVGMFLELTGKATASLTVSKFCSKVWTNYVFKSLQEVRGEKSMVIQLAIMISTLIL